jgi:hypothetical protein
MVSVHPSGTASAAARNSPALKEYFLRLPDIPIIVIITPPIRLPPQLYDERKNLCERYEFLI